MADPVITNIDVGEIAIAGAELVRRQDILALAGADTLAAGTILARDSVSLKLVIFVKGGVANENGIPKAVLPYPVTATAAGDVAVSVIAAGTVNRNRLVIDADGDASNVDDAVLDQLRDFGITARNVTQLAQLDNQ